MTNDHQTNARRAHHGVNLLLALLEAADAELSRPTETIRADTLHGIVQVALSLTGETAKLAERLLEPMLDLTLPTDINVPLDRATRRLLDVRAAGLGRTVEDLSASIIRRAARATWSESRRART